MKTNSELEAQLQSLQAENELLRQKSQELEQQNQQLQNELNNVVVPDYEAVRDRILNNWRVLKAPETKERIKKALDMLIEGIIRE